MTKEVQSNETVTYTFDEAFEQVKKEVVRVLSSSPVIVREYTKHLTKTEGKYVRAICVLTCAMGENDRICVNAVKLAAAVEILHLATLVHDDVIDNADFRRGRPTLQKKYGKRTAVICGDYLLSLALNLASDVTGKEEYRELKMPNYVSRICMGELSQHINNGNYNLGVYDYLKIISGKTAALFEASCFGGAALIEKDRLLLNRYGRFGRYIGMIFQLTDDCMDFEATVITAKKPVQSDYEHNVITLPLIHAFRSVEGLKEKAEKGRLTREDINDTVEKTGGLLYTRTLAKKYDKKALNLLNELDLTAEKRKSLEGVLKKAYRVF